MLQTLFGWRYCRAKCMHTCDTNQIKCFGFAVFSTISFHITILWLWQQTQMSVNASVSANHYRRRRLIFLWSRNVEFRADTGNILLQMLQRRSKSSLESKTFPQLSSSQRDSEFWWMKVQRHTSSIEYFIHFLKISEAIQKLNITGSWTRPLDLFASLVADVHEYNGQAHGNCWQHQVRSAIFVACIARA